jgi:hypothetical protein
MASDLKSGHEMVKELMKGAETFDDKYKAFMAWLRWKELEQRQKRGGMGSGFDEPGGQSDDGGDI